MDFSKLPKRVMVGVSGGMDSISLLHALTKEKGREIIVLHFNHGWRKEGDEEMLAVKELAESYGVEFYSGKQSEGKKTETRARKSRFEFFQREAEKLGCKDLVLAHHKDDQIETFLMQLLRGTGSGGVGIKKKSCMQGLNIHRPFLEQWHEEILIYAKKEKLSWLEDPTNQERVHLRNKIRHDLIPYLEKNYQPSLKKQLWRMLEIRSGEEEWLREVVKEGGMECNLEVKRLREMTKGEQRYRVRGWLQAEGVEDLSFEDIEIVRGFLEKEKPSRVNLGGNRHIGRRKGYLYIE